MGVRVKRNLVGKVLRRRLSDYVLHALPGSSVAVAVQIAVRHALGVSCSHAMCAATKLLKEGKAY